jgi:hypothetical protein
MPQSRAPLIVAIVLLLLPLLYVGSYLALVVPGGPMSTSGLKLKWPEVYRFGSPWTDCIFWPLEQVDRKVRPRAWNRFSSLYDEAIAD